MSAGVVYRFEGGELDGASHRLLVGGDPVELEPKAFSVLEDLLAHAGTMRSHDELLDAVWGHRHVTPGVLNRCIGQVRKALGDHAESPRYIETLHRLGYRFIAPVEVVQASVSAVTTAPTPRRRTWILAAAVGVVAFVGVFAWRGHDGASVAQPATQVVLAPFVVPPNSADLTPQVRALEASVLLRLRALPGLRVERGLARADAIVVEGEVVGTPSRGKLRVRVRNGPAAFDHTYPLQLATLGDTGLRVQGDIARLLRPDTAALLDGNAGDANEAMRSGERAKQGLTQRDRRDALVAFKRALQLDPTNADAWCHLAEMQLTAAYEAQVTKDEALPLANASIERGLRLDPMSAQCHTQRGEALRLQKRYDEAARAYERALALEPTLLEPRIALVLIDGARGLYLRERDGLERIVREHPEAGWAHCMLIGAYARTGAPDKARAFEATVYARHPELRRVNWQSPGVEMMYGRPAAGILRYREIAALDPDDRTYYLTTSEVASLIGDTASAKADLDRSGALVNGGAAEAHVYLFFAIGDPAGAVEWLRAARLPPSAAMLQRAFLAQALALAGRREEAVREYARVYEGDWRDADPIVVSGAPPDATQLLNYASLLAPGALRTSLIDAADRHLAISRKNGLATPWVDYQAAQIAAIRGDRDTAMQHFDRALDAGFTDLLALTRDLPWRALAGDVEFEKRKARLASIAQVQRTILAGDAVDPSVVTR